MNLSLKARIFGFVTSLLLTLAAFSILMRPDLFHLELKIAIFSILLFALLQCIVQSVCFLNLWSERGPRWNLAVFVSTLFIIIVIVAGSMWIMHHLDYNMMPSVHGRAPVDTVQILIG